ncbi:MAG: RagB/SusD family nutrient uptake outer membrane protein [Parabacteroides sp.]
MKRFINISFLSLVFAGMALTGCNDDLTTSSYVKVNDQDVLGNVSQLEKVLTSAYKQLYFNTDKGDRVYAGLPGFQMYVDASGPDVISHTNMGGDQVTAYQYSNSKTQADGNASKIWSMCYNVINRANIILTNVDAAAGDETQKKHIKGQALAMRGIQYFHLIQNYQQTYDSKKWRDSGRTFSDDESHKGFSTVEEIYTQIVSDLTTAKTLLADYNPDDMWLINSKICSGILARVYLVMQNWDGAYTEAKIVYLIVLQPVDDLREQYRSGFDDMISGNYAEVVWAINIQPIITQVACSISGITRMRYGEGYADGPIYRSP